MKITKFAFTFSVSFCAALFFLTPYGLAADPMIPPLPYTHTWNCPETSYTTLGLVCNNLGFDQNPNDDGLGHQSQIATASNFSLGGGFRGFRQWLGIVKNESSPGQYYNFFFGGGPTPRQETNLWIRWYIRYQPGFTFGGGSPDGHKIIYFQKAPSGVDSMYLEFAHGNLRLTNGADIINSIGGFGLNNFWNLSGTSSTADGSWHCAELHYKVESSVGARNAEAQLWIDDVLRLNGSGFATGSAGIPAFTLPSNNHESGTGGAIWLDIDDLAISNTGRIGCPYPYATMGTAPASSSSPASPSGLQVK